MESVIGVSKRSMHKDERESLLTGEYIIPGTVPSKLYDEHISRYALAARVSRGMRVLDMACGTGYGAAYLLDQGAKKVIGGDISPAALKWASHFGKKEDLSFVRLDAGQLPFPTNYFDVVCSFETIEHVESPIDLLSECKRVLESDGWFLCSTPNRALTAPLNLVPVNPHHRHELSRREFRRLLNHHFADITMLGQDFHGLFKAPLVALKSGILQLLAVFSPGKEFIRKAIIRNLGIDQHDPELNAVKLVQARHREHQELGMEPGIGEGVPRYLVAMARKSNAALGKARSLGLLETSTPVELDQQIATSTGPNALSKQTRTSTPRPLVSVVIPSLNAKEYLATCLESLLGQDYASIQVIVVDNASIDGTYEFVRRRFPSVKIVRSDTNIGFSGGCDRGAAESSGEYLLFCDNDVRVTGDAISELVKVIEANPEVGVLQSKMLLANNPDRIESMGGYFTSTGILYQEEKDLPSVLYQGPPREIFGAKGAFMLIRRDLYFDLGGFDTDYVAQFEDTDISWRAWLAGFRVLVVPSSIVFHARSTTTKRLPSEFVLFHASKNRICTILKNLAVGELVRVLPLHLLLTVGGASILLLRLRFSAAASLIRAIFWNILHLVPTLAKRKRARAGVGWHEGKPQSHLRRKMPIDYLISSGREVLRV